jgi:ABC-type Na+ efflux pump permease subunit
MLTKLSSVIFDSMLRGKIATQSIIILILGIISIFYPLYLLLLNSFKSCFKNTKITEQNYMVDYDELKTKFSNEYDRANPLTKDEALAEYFAFMKCSLLMTQPEQTTKPL